MRKPNTPPLASNAKKGRHEKNKLLVGVIVLVIVTLILIIITSSGSSGQLGVLLKRITKLAQRGRGLQPKLVFNTVQATVILFCLVAKGRENHLQSIFDRTATATARATPTRGASTTTARSVSSGGATAGRTRGMKTFTLRTKQSSGLRSKQVLDARLRILGGMVEAAAHNLLNDVHKTRSIWKRLVVVICRFMNLAPKKI